MNIQEAAEQYAKGHITSTLERALEEAYREGYKKGYEDGSKKVKNISDDESTQAPAKKLDYDGVTFIDMGLPSGTLWAKCCLTQLMTFIEAHSYSIPTIEQWEELKRTCIFKTCDGGLQVISTEGNSIWIKTAKQFISSRGFTHNILSFWLDEEPSNSQAKCVKARWTQTGKKISGIVGTSFMGEHLPIIIVKTPK